jgi:hypothetical protein
MANGFLLNIAQTLGDARDSVQNWTNERLAVANRTVFGGDGKDPLFNTEQLAAVRANIDKFKARVDPRNKNPASNGNELGSTTLSNSAQDVGPFFNLLPTMDVWKVQQQATSLRGLVAGKLPVIPMVFAVIPALSAERQAVPEPLFLFVNPKSWSRSMNKVQTNHYVRNGITTERWGEELEQITASGMIGGYYTLETGLTRTYRRQTPSYRNLMMLLQIFKNNGCVYDNTYQGAAPSSNKRVIDVGAIEILYDKEIFRGTFDTFSIKEAADKPYTLEYSFVFHVESSIHISDITPTSTSVNNSTIGASGPNQVHLAEGQTIPTAENDAELARFQQLLNNNSEIADRASQLLNQNKVNSLLPVSKEAGFQSTTSDASVLLKEQLKK